MELDSPHVPASASARQVAQRYLERGWSVIPVPHRSKNPGFKRWEQLRLSCDQLDQHFNGQPQNISVLLGEPSGWLIDVDLDHRRAVELAAQFLPPTALNFGGPGKPQSHWLYRVTAPLVTKKFSSRSSGMIVEVRSTGTHTVFPPSTHEIGEPITWDDEQQEPAEIDPELLLESAQRLAEAVLIELGEKRPARAHQKRLAETPHTPDSTLPAPSAPDDRAARCLAAMLRIRIADQRDGSRRLFSAACRAVEHDLDDTTAVALIREYTGQRPFPRDWSDAEIVQRLRDAESHCRRAQALELAEDGCIPLGNREPQSGKLVLSPTRTLPTAESFVREFYLHPDGRTIHCYAGALTAWRNNRYGEQEDNAVKGSLQAWLHDALRYVLNRGTGELELVDFQSNPSTVKAALESLKAYCHLPATTVCPSWLDGAANRPSPGEIVPCRSFLLHLPTMRRLPATPLFFSSSALEFDPDPGAPEPLDLPQRLHRVFVGGPVERCGLQKGDDRGDRLRRKVVANHFLEGRLVDRPVHSFVIARRHRWAPGGRWWFVPWGQSHRSQPLAKTSSASRPDSGGIRQISVAQRKCP